MSTPPPVPPSVTSATTTWPCATSTRSSATPPCASTSTSDGMQSCRGKRDFRGRKIDRRPLPAPLQIVWTQSSPDHFRSSLAAPQSLPKSCRRITRKSRLQAMSISLLHLDALPIHPRLRPRHRLQHLRMSQEVSPHRQFPAPLDAILLSAPDSHQTTARSQMRRYH